MRTVPRGKCPGGAPSYEDTILAKPNEKDSQQNLTTILEGRTTREGRTPEPMNSLVLVTLENPIS